MRELQIKENFKNKELVFAITLHPVLGYLIEAFAVSRNARGQFEYGFRKVAKNTVWDYVSELSPGQNALISLIDKYSDDNLQKRFSKPKTRTRDFYSTLDDAYVAKFIRPFLERTIYEILRTLPNYGIKLYYKGENADRIRETPLKLHADLAQTCFHFEKLPENTLYRLQLIHNNKELKLFNSNAVLLTQKPCVLLMKKEIFCFDPQWEGQKFKPFLGKEFLEIPATSEKDYYEKFVQKSILHHPFKAKGFEVREFHGHPKPLLRMETHWQGNIMLGLYFAYGKVVFHCGDTTMAKVKFVQKWPEFYFEKVGRASSFENDMILFLKEQGLKRQDGAFFAIPEEEIPVTSNNQDAQMQQIHACIDWLSAHSHILHEMGFELEKEIARKKYHTGVSDLTFATQEKTDWFDLEGKVWFGSFEIPFSHLRENILSGNREYELPDGTIALIPEEWMTTYHDLMLFARKNGHLLEVKKHHFALLKSIPNQGLNLPEFKAMGRDDQFEYPSGLRAELRPYQQAGYHWMMFMRLNRLGGCLADDMGLGKTLQALALLSRVHLDEVSDPNLLKDNGPENISMSAQQLSIFESAADTPRQTHMGNCSLIIMPLSLVHNWTEEARRFAPGLKVMQHTGVQRSADVFSFSNYDLVLTTYGTVRNDIEMLSKYHFRYIILDESQIIKNASSKIFTAIKQLQCEFRLVLSGTPVENSLTDLWSQFSFINPGMLGSLNFFRNEFVIPIEKKQDEIASKKLQNLIKPFILRRTKSQVTPELPDLTEKIYYCEMTPEQEHYYESRKSEIRNAIMQEIENRGADKSRFLLLSGLTKLRLVANHPTIVDQEYAFESGKYNEIIRNVEILLAENHKVLIFSQFVKHLNLFRDYFQIKKYDFSLLTGNVSEKQRKEVIARFQQDENNRLFLISLKAGGVGLNLTGADYVFMLDPWWNPAVENQAINRAHRIGQDKNVFVYKFITRNTVEEKIVKLQERKTHLAGMFINENNPLKSLSLEELQELI